MLSVNPIARVVVNAVRAAASPSSFDTGLLLIKDTNFTASRRLVTCDSSAAALAQLTNWGFASNTEPYKAALKYFAASPAPSRLLLSCYGSSESLEQALAAVLNITASFYGVALGQTETDVRVLALDEYVATLDKPLMLFLPVIGTASAVVASGSLLQTLYSWESKRTVPFYCASVSDAAALMGTAMLNAVRQCTWVRKAKVYENYSNSTDARGIPAHSLATVIYAGNGPEVAKAIFETKAPGIGTYGSTYEDIIDEGGNTQRVYFSRTTTSRVYAYMTIRRLAGCDEAAITAAITAAVNDYVNNQLDIGESLIIPRLYAVAYNADPSLAQTFAISDVYANLQGQSTYTRDEVGCAWNSKISILENGGLTITFTD